MLFDTLGQPYIFLATLYGGLLMGGVTDLATIIRNLLKKNKILIAIADIAMWILITIIAFNIMVVAADGQVKFFMFLGFFLGWLIYKASISVFIKKIYTFIGKHLGRIFARLKQTKIIKQILK